MSLDGVDDSPRTNVVGTTLFTTTALTAIMLVKIDANGGTGSGADRHLNPHLFGVNSFPLLGAVIRLDGLSNTVLAYANFGAGAVYTSALTVTNGDWVMIALTLDSSNLELTKNVSTAAAISGGTLASASLGQFTLLGTGLSGSPFADIEILEMATYNTKVTTATLNTWKAYFNARYALSL